MIKMITKAQKIKKTDVKSSKIGSGVITITSGNNWEKKFQAEEDARTLARYEEIMNDKSRKSAAIAEAKKQAVELQKKADALKRATAKKG